MAGDGDGAGAGPERAPPTPRGRALYDALGHVGGADPRRHDAGACSSRWCCAISGLTGIDGLEEVPRYLFVWLVMIGAAAAMQRGEHTVLDYFVNLLRPARPRRSSSC